MNQSEQDSFYEAVESLKKYRRADLINEDGKNLLEILYTDLLPNEHILKQCLRENTTFLIGRKGTGKSTIFLRVEGEIRKTSNKLACYLDVKTIYESSQAEYAEFDYLNDLLPVEVIKKYLIERNFIQSVLLAIQKELENKTKSIFERFVSGIGIETEREKVLTQLKELKSKIENNEFLKQIEIPVIKTISQKSSNSEGAEVVNESKFSLPSLKGSLNDKGASAEFSNDTNIGKTKKHSTSNDIEKEFSNIFLQVFQVKEIISSIQNILRAVGIKHLFVLLDDYSEIDDKALKSFVDVVLAPLNNWSEEFIKFKIAAYPNRIYYGKIDPGKIDTINLDFYNLYSQFDRDKMEGQAIDFTKRLIEKRISHYTEGTPEDFFNVTSSTSLSDFYELLFQVSMNVPRILGYILTYCYQSRIILGRKINRSDIEAASEKYYLEKIKPFFDTTTYSLMSIDEKVSELQFKELLNVIIDNLTSIRKRITSSELRGSNYNPSNPFTSHFYFDPRLEEFIKTLELNFFISKYENLSDKDGNESSIYSINYGLAKNKNLKWGKPKTGKSHRKYFIERPFNFNKLITEFLENSRSIHCINPDCGEKYGMDQLQFLEFTEFKCGKCHHPVISEPISKNIRNKLASIEETKLLPAPEMKILDELNRAKNPVYAREISEEIDYSKQLIAARSRKLDKNLELVERVKDNDTEPYKYKISEKGKKTYFEKEE